MGRNFGRLIAATSAAALLAAFPAQAQRAQVPVVSDTAGNPIAAGAVICVDLSGVYSACGGGGATGDAAVPSTNASGTVTTGGSYQTVFVASTARKGCLIQNPTTAIEILNVRVGAAAVYTLPIGATFSCASPGGLVVSDIIAVTGATTGHAFTAISQ